MGRTMTTARCLYCSRFFLIELAQVTFGWGKYCNKNCWSEHVNLSKVHSSGFTKAQREEIKRRIRAPKVKREIDSLNNPFFWMKSFKMNKRGRKYGTFESKYGIAVLMTLRIPINIKKALNENAIMTKRSVSKLVLKYVLDGMFSDEQLIPFLKPAPKGSELGVEVVRQFDWTDEGIALLEQTYSEGLDQEEDQTLSKKERFDEASDYSIHTPTEFDEGE